ncbi:MAG: hypothetical protein H6718_08895 [Polyangiaceae bacterium]|nr:hypothetical protein [Myxococcales bacterium]MCB9585502.1 hypothetical protein [Polyangiaceae bacterium]MCB9606482.1 hypothetical protein [Polyangiaceae bacterium]
MSESGALEHSLLNLAHELRNYLLVVQGNIGLIQRQPADVSEVLELAGDNDEASRRADEVVTAIQRKLREHLNAASGSSPARDHEAFPHA